MKCSLNNSLSFAKSNAAVGNNSANNGALNVGVVAPPDKLPNASLSDTIYSNESPKEQLETGGPKNLTAGKVSSILAFIAMGLSAVSLLPFVRKR